ncbi:hypothetical protein [Morganella morganii]|nr:hypothetical protein [Morganella morganii]EKT0593460.1 hypothetical protein [Morganella morganii]EKU0270280.1 hypothetical protein [Morganella morganii]ELF0884874.1 hypothetical protein [Morganella morganii]MBT0389275.1 hypothetical protein [Morganella morganii subsp. morganii]MBT0395956.1 hypothetical protein [Morganella morganii subsp. morganii]
MRDYADAAHNCTLWVIYGFKVKDLPVAVANAPGVLSGLAAMLTAL